MRLCSEAVETSLGDTEDQGWSMNLVVEHAYSRFPTLCSGCQHNRMNLDAPAKFATGLDPVFLDEFAELISAQMQNNVSYKPRPVSSGKL